MARQAVYQFSFEYLSLIAFYNIQLRNVGEAKKELLMKY